MSKSVPLPPLFLKNPLALQPKTPPQWSIEVTLRDGVKVAMADPRATRALVALMDMEAVIGGAASHFGGPSAFAELMSALYGLVFYRAQKEKKAWYEIAHIINDAGHCENGLYALKANYEMAQVDLKALKDFRSIKSPLTGHGESHLFPEGVYLSNGPLGSSLPQAQGLCFADYLAGKSSRITITAISDGACMEGEAREALAAIPGLAQKGKMAPFILVISDNNTKLTGRIDEDSYSMKPTFESLMELGWQVLDLDFPHDLQNCVTTFEEAFAFVEENPYHPLALRAKTIKGFGVKKTEDSSSGGHGFPLSDAKDLPAFLEEIYGGSRMPREFLKWAEDLQDKQQNKKEQEKQKTKPGDQQHVLSSLWSEKGEKIQKGVSGALIKKRQEGLPLFSISADLPGSTGVREFQKTFPDSAQDVGVAEANMVSMAAGLSKQGYIPIVDTFAQFGVTKGSLPLIMASLSQAPVIGFFSHTGFQDAADGASHQALSWLSMTASIPFTECYALTSSEEAEELVSQAIDRFVRLRKAGQTPPSTLFFLGRENFPLHYGLKRTDYQLGRGQLVYQSQNLSSPRKVITICAAGSLLIEGLRAAQELEKQNVASLVINPSCLNHPDMDLLTKCLSLSDGHLITVEDHQLIGGMGAIISHALILKGVSIRLKSLGVKGEFGRSAYQAKELYKKHQLDSQAIVQAVLD